MALSKQRSGGNARPLGILDTGMVRRGDLTSMTRPELARTRDVLRVRNPHPDGGTSLAGGVSEQVRRSRKGRSREGGLGASSLLRSIHGDLCPSAPRGCPTDGVFVASPGVDTTSGPNRLLPRSSRKGLPVAASLGAVGLPNLPRSPVGGVHPPIELRASAVRCGPGREVPPTCAAPSLRPRAVQPSPAGSHADGDGTHARRPGPPRGSGRRLPPGSGFGRSMGSPEGRRT